MNELLKKLCRHYGIDTSDEAIALAQLGVRLDAERADQATMTEEMEGLKNRITELEAMIEKLTGERDGFKADRDKLQERFDQAEEERVKMLEEDETVRLDSLVAARNLGLSRAEGESLADYRKKVAVAAVNGIRADASDEYYQGVLAPHLPSGDGDGGVGDNPDPYDRWRRERDDNTDTSGAGMHYHYTYHRQFHV